MYFTDREIVSWKDVFLETKFGTLNSSVFWEPKLGDAFLAASSEKTEKYSKRWGYKKTTLEDKVWLGRNIIVRARRLALLSKNIAPDHKSTYILHKGKRIEAFVPIFYAECLETNFLEYITITSNERKR